MRSEKPIRAPPRLSEVSQTLNLKKSQYSSDWRWPFLVLSKVVGTKGKGKDDFDNIIINVLGWYHTHTHTHARSHARTHAHNNKQTKQQQQNTHPHNNNNENNKKNKQTNMVNTGFVKFLVDVRTQSFFS